MQIYLLLPQAPGARNVGRHYRATTVQGPAALRRADGRTHAQRRTVRFQAGQLAESKAHATVHPRLQMQVAGPLVYRRGVQLGGTADRTQTQDLF